MIAAAVTPKKTSKSLPPIRRKVGGSYIEKTLDLVDAGCYNNSKLSIDGGYGDYCMRLFRKKDKN